LGVIAPRAVVARMVQSKQLCDLHTDQFSQALLFFYDRGLDGQR